MNYYVVESTFNETIPVDDKSLIRLIEEHKNYLQAGFDQGWILFSGPKAVSGGGVIVMKGKTFREIENFFLKDPMKTAGIQNYTIIEFKLHDCQPEIKGWFK